MQTTDPAPSALAAAGLADSVMLSIADVCALVGCSEATIRSRMKQGRVPLPDYRDGPRCVRWTAGTVRRWLAERTGGES